MQRVTLVKISKITGRVTELVVSLYEVQEEEVTEVEEAGACSSDVVVHIIRKMQQQGRMGFLNRATRVRLTDYYFKFTLRNVYCSHKAAQAQVPSAKHLHERYRFR